MWIFESELLQGCLYPIFPYSSHTISMVLQCKHNFPTNSTALPTLTLKYFLWYRKSLTNQPTHTFVSLVLVLWLLIFVLHATQNNFWRLFWTMSSFERNTVIQINSKRLSQYKLTNKQSHSHTLYIWTYLLDDSPYDSLP